MQAKAAQLLTQWLALPTTETLLRLIFSDARRSPPISRDVALERNAGGRSSLPIALVRENEVAHARAAQDARRAGATRMVV